MKKLSLIFSKSIQVLTATIAAFSTSLSTAAMAADSPSIISSTIARELRFNQAIPQDSDHTRQIVRMGIRLGANSCSARGMEPFVEARHEGRNLVLYPRTIRKMNAEPEVCTTEHRPVYATYDFEVSTAVGRFENILVSNVQAADGSIVTVNLNQ